jgi:hypothetical protein
MLAYIIEQARPSDDARNNNIITSYYSSKKDKLNEKIIDNIIYIMYEFCSNEYGHNIKIISYDDFCDKYWKIYEIRMYNYNIFNVYYFENDWIEWKVENNKEDIYISYVNKFGV